jgi:hypothetical protein
MGHETVKDFVNWEDVAECTDHYLNRALGNDFDAKMSALLVEIEAKYLDAFPNHHRKMVLSLTAGSKWIKVIEGSSVWGFVGKADGVYKGISYKKGDVFKPASWNAPAKWARGSIFDENKDWYRWTGPNYL